MTDDDFDRRVLDILGRHHAAMLGELGEMNARVSALQFLMQQLYANAFAGLPEDFEAFMDGAIQKCRARPTLAEPMTDDELVELQVRVATHLTRFRDQVAARIRQP